MPVLVLVTACSTAGGNLAAPESSAVAGVSTLVPAGYDGRYRGTFTVLENLAHGPQACASVGESDPPTCEGPDVIGWNWSGLDAISGRGTTYGRYVVTGMWDGVRLRLTEPPHEAFQVVVPSNAQAEPRPSTSCPVPDGGWPEEPWANATDPEFIQDRTLHEIEVRAQLVPGYGEIWLDRRENATIVNVTTTGDTAVIVDAVRQVYLGPLCVTQTLRSKTELQEMQNALSADPNVLYSSIDSANAVLQVTAMAETTEFQQSLDAEFGSGSVVVYGLLEPIDLR
ncbi:MAG: hypothetical protein ACR2JK_00145 [Geodermatophilaceae bacterium]